MTGQLSEKAVPDFAAEMNINGRQDEKIKYQ
jgi:hypothetical protein